MKKTLKALFLCLFLCLGILSLPISAYAEEGEGEVKDIVEKVELYKEGEPISSGDVISLGDQFELTYTLFQPLFLNYTDDEKDPEVNPDHYIKKGDKIILPNFPKILTEYPHDISISIKDLDDPLGVVTLDDDGNILLEVTNDEYSDLSEIVFGISCKLDGDKVGDKKEIEMKLPGFETPFKFDIKENQEEPEPDPGPVDPPLKDKYTLKKNFKDIQRTDDNKDAIITWEITLGNKGYDFDNFVLYDKFTMDSKTDMSLIPDSITVSKGGEDITSDVSVNTSAGNSQFQNLPYDFSVDLGTLSGESSYVVTYKSLLKNYDTYLQQNHSSAPNNETWFEYGDEEHHESIGKIKGKDGLTAKPGIVKNLTSYDAANHKITWTIKANTSKQPLTDVKITEEIGAGQKLVEITNAKLDGEPYDISDKYAGVPGKFIEGTDEYSEYLITLGNDIKEKTLEFDVVTELLESEKEFYSGNKEQKYKNKVVMNSYEMKNVSDEIEKTCKSEVLTKRIVGNYNYETHEFQYEIVANKNKMAMSKISVKDGLTESGLELIIATDKPIMMNGVEIPKGSDDNPTRPCYTYNNGLLTVYPENTVAGEADSMKTITFTARVKDEKYLDNITSSSISIANNASIETEDYPTTTIESKDAKREIKNSMFNKKGDVINDKTQAGYTILVNASKQNLRDGCKVRDILGANLDLEESSVKLYVANINPATGDLSDGEEATGYKTDVKTNSNGTTQLEVTLPKNTGKTSYVLKYIATPDLPKVAGGDYSNSAELLDSGIDAEFKSNIDLSNAKFSSGSSTGKASLTITKADDEDSSVLLKGAVFSIIDKATQEEVAQLTTGENGSGKVGLPKGKEYIVKEIKAPDGYELNEEPYEFNTNKGRVNLNFTNKKKEPEPDVPNPGNDDENKDDNKNGNNSGSNNSGNNSDNKDGNNSDYGSGDPSNGSDNNGSGGSSDSKHHSSDDHHDNNGGNGNNDSNANNAAANTNANTNAAANKNAANANANNGNKPKIIVKAPSEYDDLLLSDEEIKAKGYEVVDGATIEGGDPNYEYIIGPNGEVLGARKKAVAGAKLAKTGGFVGTLVSYIIGGVAVIIGTVLLVINPKKAHNRKRR